MRLGPLDKIILVTIGFDRFQFVKRDELRERKLLVANTMTRTAFAAAQQVPMAAIAITRSENLSSAKATERSKVTTDSEEIKMEPL